MSVVQIATRYASAILEEAQHQGVLEEIHGDVMLLQQAVDDSHDLQLMLKSPIVSTGIKKSSLRMIFDGKVNPLTGNFLALLVDKRREAYLVSW